MIFMAMYVIKIHVRENIIVVRLTDSELRTHFSPFCSFSLRMFIYFFRFLSAFLISVAGGTAHPKATRPLRKG
jgi:hypothetical protein